MMSFMNYMPVEIIFDKDCVLKNRKRFDGYKKVFIVSDQSSARLSGALDDILSILNDTKADFFIFDKIRENPLLSVCYEGGKAAFEFGADLIVGIGGGSSMDASKTIALYAVNPNMQPDGLFNPPYENQSLPFFAIPTTAGTGSEANPYAMITLDGQELKKSFGYVKSFAQIAFLDPKYTFSLPYYFTVSTALDALCHCVESYLTVKTTPFSKAYTGLGIKSVYRNLEKLADLKDKPLSEIDYAMREELMLGALCGGMAINITGTCFPHPLGYNITLAAKNGIPHGKACALFLGELLDIHENVVKTGGAGLDDPDLLPILTNNLNEIYHAFNSPVEKVKETIKILVDYHEKFDDETLRFYASKTKAATNFANSFKKINEEEMFMIYKNCVGK